MRLFKPSTIDTDEQIHQYTQDIETYIRELKEAYKDGILEQETIEHMHYNLKVMTLVQQRLLEGRG